MLVVSPSPTVRMGTRRRRRRGLDGLAAGVGSMAGGGPVTAVESVQAGGVLTWVSASRKSGRSAGIVPSSPRSIQALSGPTSLVVA